MSDEKPDDVEPKPVDDPGYMDDGEDAADDSEEG